MAAALDPVPHRGRWSRLDEVHATSIEGLPPLEELEGAQDWGEVAADPAPFLSLGLVTPAWLERSLAARRRPPTQRPSTAMPSSTSTYAATTSACATAASSSSTGTSPAAATRTSTSPPGSPASSTRAAHLPRRSCPTHQSWQPGSAVTSRPTPASRATRVWSTCGRSSWRSSRRRCPGHKGRWVSRRWMGLCCRALADAPRGLLTQQPVARFQRLRMQEPALAQRLLDAPVEVAQDAGIEV
jgi:hypothetical protein